MGRSFRASKDGAKTASDFFKLTGWTQDHLAGRAGCSRTTVNKFFHRGRIEKRIFLDICAALKLDWEDIAELESEEKQRHRDPHITGLVQEIRQKVHDDIQSRCGTMRVLDMEQSIGLDDIYTNVNILEKITGRRRVGIADLLGECDLENFDRFQLGDIRQKRVSGLEAFKQHRKLMVLGKPGSGKTTFLKRLAVQCNLGEFQPDLVPIFIPLKEFAETKSKPGLLTYIVQQFARCQVQDLQAAEVLLSQGKGLVLLDGLDEVREADHNRILQEIRGFSQQFAHCQFVMTCRIAAREYIFEQFVEVEMADFDKEQIAEFSHKWFRAKEDPVKAETFVQKLKENKPVLELATNPLLLTLLCLVFGESADFPANRSELYKEGLDVLLKKWDAKRNIERDEVYKKLSRKRKEGLLSKIAFTTFERGEYFFKQKTVERQIADYIDNLPEASTDPEAQQLESEAILKSIEAQHGLLVERAKGIYSFSHLTFQEYFTAQKIVSSPADLALDALQSLVSRITQRHWREVFLLAVGMLEPADTLLRLMKRQIDELVVGDEKLQEFLAWIERKAKSVETPYKLAAVRAFYLSLDRVLDRILGFSLNLSLDRAQVLGFSLNRTLNRALDLFRDLSLDFDFDRTLSLDRTLNFDLSLDFDRTLSLDLSLNRDLNRALSLDFDRALSLDRALDLSLNRDLKQALQALKDQLPDPESDRETREQWWNANGKVWAKKLREVMVQHRNIGHDWQFNKEQKERLQQYYDANKLLVDCLNSDCYITRSVREEIEATLLLPHRATREIAD